MLACTFGLNAQNVYRGAGAEKIAKGAQVVRVKSFTNVPNYVEFRKDAQISLEEVPSYLQRFYKENHDKLGLKLIKQEKDELGMVHYRYLQTYEENVVQMSMYIVHTKGGKVISMNGELMDGSEFSQTAFQLGEAAALQKALDHIGAKQYKWQVAREEEHLKWEQDNPNATYFPKGHKVYINKGGLFSNDLTAAYRFNIYAHEPLSRAEYFVDAQSGEVVFESNWIQPLDSPGTAVTAYSGTQPLVADWTGSTFRLRETGRGNGIRTFDLNNSTNHGNGVDFTDGNNYWNNVNPQQDEVATDAHWGAEMTYDYFWNIHNRNSIDGNGFRLDSYVHYGTNYNNAFWDGQRMTYGDGNGSTFTPLTAIDVTAHEIGHGLTTNTANLVYQNEPGALNESFSDIFGAAVEAYAVTNKQTWRIGEDMTPNNQGIRNMQNPNLFGDPDTYLGTNWYSGTADNGGVHTNSGVQNKWFYILTQGESGTNDLSNSYNVTGIGITKAARVAFRNLTVYLTTNSQYNDARFYGVQSSIDLYGACTPEHIATTDAWYAVGVGGPFQTGVIAGFDQSATTGCLPMVVQFTDTSTNTNAWTWDFGDGNTSTQQNPTHQYTQYGTFNVKLVADGGLCGKDSTVNVGLITITGPAAPVGTNDTVNVNQQATLTATAGSGTLNWYTAQFGGNYVGSGTSYTTPPLPATTSYWVEDSVPNPTQNVGPPNNSFGGGNNFTFNQYLIFDVFKPCELVSVLVYASNGPKNRTVELRDQNGTVLQQATINIPNGTQRISLNFSLTPGTDYQLGISQATTPDLFRNNSGPSYPYTLPGLVSITRSSANTNPFGYYYFYYDWEVREAACESPRTKVDGVVQFPVGISQADADIDFTVYPNPTNDQATVTFNVTENGNAQVDVIDLRGKVVRNLHSGNITAGSKTYNFSVRDIAEGVYHVRVTTDAGSWTRRLAVMK